jgi:hypothetical protein
MLMSQEEQKKIAAIVNALIDIPLVPEDMEQTIFEHAVTLVDQALQDVLPAAFSELLRNAETGIDKDHARQFSDRLVVAVNNRIDLPYLNEDQEYRLLQTVIDPVVKGMVSGKKLDDLLPPA